MKLVRTFFAAFLVLFGVMMIVVWGFTTKTVAAIDDGTAAARLTDTVLSSPQVADLAADKVTDRVHDALAENIDAPRFELLWGFAEGPIHSGVVDIINSDFVQDASATAATKAQAELLKGLQEDNRPYGPLLLTIDLSDRINARIDTIPLVGNLIPTLTVPPLEYEVIAADVFQDMRMYYNVAKWVSTWFVWLGLALILIGVLIAPRRGWFLARSMLVTGVLVLAVAFTVNALGAASIASLVPGGTDGALGVTVSDLLSDSAIPKVTNLLMRLGLMALFLALVTVVVVKFSPAFSRQMRARLGQNNEPLVHEASSGGVVAEAAVPATHAGPVQSAPSSVSATPSTTASVPTSVATTIPIPDETTAHPRDIDDEETATEASPTAESTSTPDAKTLELTPEVLAAAAQDPHASAGPNAETVELTREEVAAATAKPVAKKPAATASAPVKKPAPKKPAAKKPPVTASAPVEKPAAKKPAPKKPAAKKPVAKKATPKDEPPTSN